MEIAFVSLHQCFRVPERDTFIVINLCLTERLNYNPDRRDARTSHNTLFIRRRCHGRSINVLRRTPALQARSSSSNTEIHIVATYYTKETSARFIRPCFRYEANVYIRGCTCREAAHVTVTVRYRGYHGAGSKIYTFERRDYTDEP